VLRGELLTEANIEAAPAQATQGVTPLSDQDASADYRIHLAQRYTARALKALVQS
jgi:CO/xanthine dehydrogenase FAD-binding subunit